jgi:hypothetical protein
VQIRVFKKGGKRNTWLVAVERKEGKIYFGWVISPCLEKGEKGRGMLLFMIGKYERRGSQEASHSKKKNGLVKARERDFLHLSSHSFIYNYT